MRLVDSQERLSNDEISVQGFKRRLSDTSPQLVIGSHWRFVAGLRRRKCPETNLPRGRECRGSSQKWPRHAALSHSAERISMVSRISSRLPRRSAGPILQQAQSAFDRRVVRIIRPRRALP